MLVAHGECSPGGFILAHAVGQQGIEVAVGLCPCTGGLVQFAGHVIADGFLSAVGSPLAVAVVVVNITASLGIDLLRVTHLEAQDVLVEVVIDLAGGNRENLVGILRVKFVQIFAGFGQFSSSFRIVLKQFIQSGIIGVILCVVVGKDFRFQIGVVITKINA